MATTTYTVINGVIVHEDRNGVQRNYRPDTLGNTVALTDATTATDTMTYWPYGEIRTRTGTNATRFLFVGTLGYSKDGGSGYLHYVRARYYQASRGRWATVDPLWPDEPAYTYSYNSPADLADASGLTPWEAILCGAACLTAAGCLTGVWMACNALWGQPEFIDCVLDYISSLPPISQWGCLIGVIGCLTCIYRYTTKCKKPICPPSVKKALDGAVDSLCKNRGKRGCSPGDSCAVLRSKSANIGACIAARLGVMFICYGGGNAGHWKQVGQEGIMLGKCVGLMKLKKCKPFGPN